MARTRSRRTKNTKTKTTCTKATHRSMTSSNMKSDLTQEPEPLPEFTPFLRLPLELRSMIWKFAIHPRVVKIELHMSGAANKIRRPKGLIRFVSKSPPGLLMACMESRIIIRQRLTARLPSAIEGDSIWVDPENDAIYIPNTKGLRKLLHHLRLTCDGDPLRFEFLYSNFALRIIKTLAVGAKNTKGQHNAFMPRLFFQRYCTLILMVETEPTGAEYQLVSLEDVPDTTPDAQEMVFLSALITKDCRRIYFWVSLWKLDLEDWNEHTRRKHGPESFRFSNNPLLRFMKLRIPNAMH